MSPIFKYHTRDTKGMARDGKIEALDENDAVNKLEEQGLAVITIEITTTEKLQIVKESKLETNFIEKNKRIILLFIITFSVLGIFAYSSFLVKREKAQKVAAEKAQKEAEEKAQKVAAEKAPGTISGHIYITVGSGESFIARGIEVYLIPKTIEFDVRNQKLDDIRSEIVSCSNRVISETSFETYNAMQVALKNISSLSEAWRLSREFIIKSSIFYSGSATELTKTNIEGEYKFEKINPSDYYIYVKYKTNFNEGYWFVPITVKADTVITLDLDNSNFFDEESAVQRKEIEHLKELLADHVETVTRSFAYDSVAVKERLEIEKAWLDSKNQPIDTGRFQYPEPVKGH